LLLQKRAKGKYHSGGLWTNTCCGHPQQGELLAKGAMRRLIEEMKIYTTLEELCTFRYKSEFENGLIENELDHIFYGFSDEPPVLNPAEAEDWKYIFPDQLEKEIKLNPLDYTAWLRIVIEKKLLGDLLTKHYKER
jgi:isopentenyl-diphosphate delta-isomerase